ncbi:MAG TPA: hypothetical protein VGC42_32290 [Kofleriaceae bacterium]
MEILNALLLIVGGVLALSGLIVAKRPDARRLIDQLVPYQAIIGVALLAFGVINLLRALSGGVLALIPHNAVLGVTILSLGVTSILLGFLFGMPQLAKWTPGNAAAEQKGLELMAKLAPYQVVLGGIAIATGVLVLLYRVGILSPLSL